MATLPSKEGSVATLAGGGFSLFLRFSYKKMLQFLQTFLQTSPAEKLVFFFLSQINNLFVKGRMKILSMTNFNRRFNSRSGQAVRKKAAPRNCCYTH